MVSERVWFHGFLAYLLGTNQHLVRDIHLYQMPQMLWDTLGDTLWDMRPRVAHCMTRLVVLWVAWWNWCLCRMSMPILFDFWMLMIIPIDPEPDMKYWVIGLDWIYT